MYPNALDNIQVQFALLKLLTLAFYKATAALRKPHIPDHSSPTVKQAVVG